MVPWRMLLKSKEIFSFAGLWEEYDDHEGNRFHTFSLITLPAEHWMLDITERSPVVFSKMEEKLWLNNATTEDQLLALLKLFPVNQFEGYNVSPNINSIEKDGPGLIIPTPPSDQFGNLTLFD
jgi:putative SOS response-associated peptidase YedK